MDNQVCMQSNNFLLFVMVGLGIIIWALYQVHQQSQKIQKLNSNKKINNDIINQNIDEIIDQRLKETESNYKKQHQIIEQLIATNQRQHEQDQQKLREAELRCQSKDYQPLIFANQFQSEQDYQRLSNPLVPPLQRSPYGSIEIERRLPINIPTRGDLDNFQVIGYAYKLNNPDNMFQLFGRRLYSNKYEYYVIHPITQIKIPINVKNNWELTKDDQIIIKGYPGEFKVEIYDLDQPRYVPY
jgi:hypothetical protein